MSQDATSHRMTDSHAAAHSPVLKQEQVDNLRRGLGSHVMQDQPEDVMLDEKGIRLRLEDEILHK